MPPHCLGVHVRIQPLDLGVSDSQGTRSPEDSEIFFWGFRVLMDSGILALGPTKTDP